MSPAPCVVQILQGTEVDHERGRKVDVGKMKCKVSRIEAGSTSERPHWANKDRLVQEPSEYTRAQGHLTLAGYEHGL